MHRERVEKEAVEENCQQLQNMTSQLQEKVGLLTLDQSQSMSVEEHRAALIEMQQWVPVCVRIYKLGTQALSCNTCLSVTHLTHVGWLRPSRQTQSLTARSLPRRLGPSRETRRPS